MARQVGIDEYFAEVTPGEKPALIKRIQERGQVTAMAGDGVSDAAALAQADVGIAIGTGTDAAGTADIILVKANPTDVADVIHLARAAYGKIVQNLMWVTGYNLVAIPLAAGLLYGNGILLSPAAGALLMSLSTVAVVMNARRIRRPETRNSQQRKNDGSRYLCDEDIKLTFQL